MNGVTLKKALIVNEDDRRKLVEISNGLIHISNLKVLFCKKGEHVLGNHWHTYPEVRYLLKGKVHYKLRNTINNEIIELDMEDGDILFTTGFITHTGIFSEDSIMIDGGQEAYVSREFNDVFDKIL